MIYFRLIIRFAGFFQCFFTLFFASRVLFYFSHLGKLLLVLDTLIVISLNLNFFLIYARKMIFHFLGAYQLIS